MGDWQAWFTLGTIGFVFLVMTRGVPPDFALWGGAILVTLVGIITPEEVLAGLAEPAVATVGALFVVSAAMRETGALDVIGRRVLGNARTEKGALARLVPQVTVLSAFLNNTAVVAMFVNMVADWCRRTGVSPGRLLMPLSFLSILGGMCTLIGTSTNLIVQDLMVAQTLPGLGMFELAWIGVPSAIIGSLYLYTLGSRLLPIRQDLIGQLGDSAREYMVELRIEDGCPLLNQTVEQAGLRQLPGLYLVEIERDSRIIAPVEPDQMLLEGDELTFAGVVGTIVDLERIPGLVPVAEGYVTDAAERRRRRYCEAVISGTSPLLGKSIRDSNFRALYNAAIIAVHRGGRRLTGRIGDIELEPGDTLLLQTGPGFPAANRNNPDFYLVSSIEKARPVRHERAVLALGLLAVLIGLLAFGKSVGVAPQVAAMLIAGLMILTRCLSTGDARRAVSLNVLLTIAGAFGLGTALKNSGAADLIAQLVVSLSGSGSPTLALAIVYGITMVMHMVVTSNATAVLMFPLAMSVASGLTDAAGMPVDLRPFAITIASASAAGFATPMSYQTNMMVFGPGGYRFMDFMRVGLPLHLLLWIVAVVVIPIFWPF